MDTLEDDEEEKYKPQFAKYLDDDVSSDTLEEIYQKAQEAINETIHEDLTAMPTELEKKDDYEAKKDKQAKLATEPERNGKLRLARCSSFVSIVHS
jgi:large subunit ribosomal protein L5e